MMKTKLMRDILIAVGVLSLAPVVPLGAQAWTPSGPVQRVGQNMVLDPVSGMMILFGGETNGNENLTDPGNGYLNDVWRSTVPTYGVTWTLVNTGTPTPAGREAGGMVYDPVSNRAIIFGGNSGSLGCDNDVWALTNANGTGGTSAWVQLSPTGGPPPARQNFVAVYDSTANTMTIFGGENCSGGAGAGLSDVWVLSNANGENGTPAWTELTPSGTPPSVNTDYAAVYDSTNHIMIVFGGYNVMTTKVTNDVWTLSNANGTGGAPVWTELSPSGGPPAPRANSSAVYNQTDNPTRMIIYGGSNPGGYLGDIWILSGANGLSGTPMWIQAGQSLKVYPNPRAGVSAVYDPVLDKMIIYGGSSLSEPAGEQGFWVLAKADGL